MRWLPHFSIETDASYSDDAGPDASGLMLEVQWGRFIFQLWLVKRGAQ